MVLTYAPFWQVIGGQKGNDANLLIDLFYIKKCNFFIRYDGFV